MAFTKGQSGNPGGRPKGAEGLIRQQVRAKLTEGAGAIVDAIQADVEKIESPDKRATIRLKLLEFALPRLSAVHADIVQNTTGEKIEWKLPNGQVIKM